MRQESFTYGEKCPFFGGITPSPSKKEVAIRAKAEGFSFIQRTQVRGDYRHVTLFAWQMEVLSYQNAIERFANDAEILLEINSHYKARKSQVFLVTPLPNGKLEVFPFDLIDKLEIVKFESLV